MQTVSFTWRYDATSVSIAGTFNDWQPELMEKKNNDQFFIINIQVAVGFTYHYKFVVDGMWCYDVAKPHVEDDAGNINNVLTLDSLVAPNYSSNNNTYMYSGVLDNKKHPNTNDKPNQQQPPKKQNQVNIQEKGGKTTTTGDPQQQDKEKKVRGPNTNRSHYGRKKDKGAIETEPTMGTRDFYPDDMRLRNWLFGHFKEIARLFAFQEYDAPILESEELYKRKAGEEITAQMYNFMSKDNIAVALRPEMTPSLARLILKSGKKMVFPIKWFSIPQCWRYETTTRGRRREHYQWNMDIVGVASVTAEAELLGAIVTLFKRLGLTSSDVGIKVNSRQLLQEVLTPLGVTAELFAPVCVIVDKLDKLEPEEVVNQLAALGLEKSVIETIQSTLCIKSLEELKSVLSPSSTVISDMNLLWKVATDYGFEDWLVFDASVVRGLAYYTGIVFECFDRGGTLRAIAGGGRYNRLLSMYGSKEEVPACGFGFGDCVIVELLRDKNLLPSLLPEVDDLVVAFDENLRGPACEVANKLRAKNRRVDMQLIPKKRIIWCYDYANRVGAERVVLIAPEEWSKRLVRIKNLRVGPGKGEKQQQEQEEEEEKQFNISFDDL